MRCTLLVCGAKRRCCGPAVPGTKRCRKHLEYYRAYQKRRYLAARAAGRCAWSGCDRRADGVYCEYHRLIRNAQKEAKRKPAPVGKYEHLNDAIAKIAGTMSDREVSKVVGCPRNYVRDIRLALGIAACRPNMGRPQSKGRRLLKWHEPTEEELDALIERQRETMPAKMGRTPQSE